MRDAFSGFRRPGLHMRGTARPGPGRPRRPTASTGGPRALAASRGVPSPCGWASWKGQIPGADVLGELGPGRRPSQPSGTSRILVQDTGSPWGRDAAAPVAAARPVRRGRIAARVPAPRNRPVSQPRRSVALSCGRRAVNAHASVKVACPCHRQGPTVPMLSFAVIGRDLVHGLPPVRRGRAV